jgi:short-subunit dehydrogenase
MDKNWRGRWALVTGASAGIGAALASELASIGAHLVLTARRKDRLEELSRTLRQSHGIRTEVFPADLADPGAPEQIRAFTQQKGMPVELLMNNAGFGQHGQLTQVAGSRLLEMVQVNCSAVVHLTRLFLPDMIERRRGDILILSSTAAFQAVPYVSTYAATKAFDLLFAEGLAEEMKPLGIRVCALCPGSTISEFHAVAGQEQYTSKNPETAEKVARTGLAALAAGKSYVISGLGNYLGAHGQRLVPRRFVARVAANMFRPDRGG